MAQSPKTTRPPKLVFAGVFLTFAASLAVPFSSPAVDEIVSCPAVVAQDQQYRRDYPGVSLIRPVLIALGTAKSVGKNHTGEDRFRLEIEEVLYGDRAATAVEFSYQHWHPEGRAIFFLAPAGMEENPAYDYHYRMEANELPAARALCAARLTAFALAADSIIVGEETRAGASVREIKVAENIAGRELPKQEPIHMSMLLAAVPGTSIRKFPGQRLYLLGPATRRGPGEPMSHAWLTDLPLEARTEVLAARRKRESYPLIDAPKESGVAHYREVLLDGDADQAMVLISSQNEAAQLLGQRYLVHHPNEGRARLAPLISEGMMQTGVAQADEFGLQQRRIASLAMIEKTSPTGALPALAEKLLTALEVPAPPVPMPVRDERKRDVKQRDGSVYRIPDEATVDTNHSLTWLLGAVGEEETARLWDERLLALQRRLEGWWQHETALAVEVLRIESNRELRAALARMKDIKPVRSEGGLRHTDAHGIQAVAFSPDGQFLATADLAEVRIWSTSDWRCLSVIPRTAGRLLFSPDSQFLYLTGRVEDSLFARYEWRTARLDRSYQSSTIWINSLQMAREGGVMLSASHMDGKLLLWGTKTGAELRSIALPPANVASALSSDGRLLARRNHVAKTDHKKSAVLPDVVLDALPEDAPACETLVESADGRKIQFRWQNDFEVTHLAFTPNMRLLVSAGTDPKNDGDLRLKVHDLTGEGRAVADTRFPGSFVNQTVVSPDGKHVAVSDQQQSFWLYSLPGLKLIWSTRLSSHRNVEDVAFSPDGKLMALAIRKATPRLIRTDTLDEIFPYAGHSDQTAGIYFSPDNQQLWSLGEDGSLCHWEAATMKMIDRRQAPEGYVLRSAQEPGGKYALYAPLEPPATRGLAAAAANAQALKPAIVDADSGKIISQIDLSVSFQDNVHWLSGGQLLVIGQAGTMLFDFVNGKTLHECDYRTFGGVFYLSADRQSLLTKLSYGEPRVPRERIDLTTGAVTRPVVTAEGESMMADGVTYTRLDNPLKTKKEPKVRGTEGFQTILSPDRRRLAVITREKVDHDENLHPGDSKPPSVIRIHDAESLRMICAIPMLTRAVEARFNTDGTQLAVARGDGVIERWPLPK